jgi:type IV pilus assembly protein PilO
MAIGANMTQREQALAGVTFVAVVLVGAYWYFMWSPKREELMLKTAHVDSLEVMNRQAKADAAAGTSKQLREETHRLRQNLEVMRQLVPTSNEVPGLLESISTAARRVGLDIASVEPLPVMPGDMFDTYRYKISVSGGYHAISGFLSNIGSLNRIIAPVTLELKPTTIDPKKRRVRPNESFLETQFQVQTYGAKTATNSVEEEEE